MQLSMNVTAPQSTVYRSCSVHFVEVALTGAVVLLSPSPSANGLVAHDEFTVHKIP